MPPSSDDPGGTSVNDLEPTPSGSGHVLRRTKRRNAVFACHSRFVPANGAPSAAGPGRATTSSASPVLVYGYLRVPPGSPDSRTRFLMAALMLSAFDLGAENVFVLADYDGGRRFNQLAESARAAGARHVLVPSLDHLDPPADDCTGTGRERTSVRFNDVRPVWPDAYTAGQGLDRDLISGPETRYLRDRGDILAAEHRSDLGRCVQCQQPGPCVMQQIGKDLKAGWR